MNAVDPNGPTLVNVPSNPVPEGARVEIRLNEKLAYVPEDPIPALRMSPTALRRMPREQRQAVLAAAAELAEQDYAADKDLTAFDAFSEEDGDDD